VLAILFPTQFEADLFIKRLHNPRSESIDALHVTEGAFEGQNLIVAVVGIGPALSAERTQLLLSHKSIDTVILAGFAGALIPAIHRGQIIVAAPYSTPALVDYIKLLPGFDIARTHTHDAVVATAADKHALAESSHCQIVDMETSAVANVVRQYHLEFLVIRCISDESHEDLPADLLSKGYDYVKGEPTPKRMAMHLLLHPLQARQLKAFLDSLDEPRKRLTAFLASVVKELA
jgi:nucleoside phosphorylase